MDVGIYQNIKRFAGGSIGALITSMLALGYSPEDVLLMMDRDLRDIAEGML